MILCWNICDGMGKRRASGGRLNRKCDYCKYVAYYWDAYVKHKGRVMG